MHDLKEIGVQVRGTGKGKVIVKSELKGKKLAEIAICATKEWKMYCKEVEISDGLMDLWFVYQGTGSIDFKKLELH